MVYLNGEFMPLEQARVPVLDRGFIFGDGIYEVIPVYDRVPLALEAHLDRLDSSLAGIAIPNPLSRSAWTELVLQVIGHEASADQSVYIQVTRGVAPRDHAFPKDPRPTVFVMAKPLTSPAPSLVADGIAAITRPDIRWDYCHLKTTALLANVLLRQAAVEAGAQECLLIRNGHVTEGAASNVLVVVDGELVTPPRDHQILPGITYDLALGLAGREGLAHRVRPVPEADLRRASEVMVCSSLREVLAVTRLDGVPVGDGSPGPVCRRLQEIYHAHKRAAETAPSQPRSAATHRMTS